MLEATVLGLASVLAANVRAASVATKRLTPRPQNLPLGRFLDEYVPVPSAAAGRPETRDNLARYRAGRWGKSS